MWQNWSMPPDDHRLLEKAIRETHGCDSFWLESVKVGENFQGQPTWHTTVDVFALVGHPKARRAYAWMIYRKGEQDRTVVILELPPVASAQDAMKAAMANKAKKNWRQSRTRWRTARYQRNEWPSRA
jgi:hypothetical protein